MAKMEMKPSVVLTRAEMNGRGRNGFSGGKNLIINREIRKIRRIQDAP